MSQEVKSISPQDKANLARAYFERGYNCAQSVAAAFSQEMGMEEDTVLGLASSFGGGMAGLRQMCGAVSGMFLVMGHLRGHYPPDDRKAKQAHYAMLRDMASQLETQYGSLICAELLQRNDIQPKPDPSERNDVYYAKRPCSRYVEACARIIAQELQGMDNVDGP